MSDSCPDSPTKVWTTAEQQHRYYQPALIETQTGLAYIYILLNAVALCIGAAGNLSLLVTLLKHRRVQSVGREFVINLAAADLCVALVSDIFCMLAVIKGEHYFVERRILCEFIASFCLTACFCAFLSLTSLTVSKMVYICYNQMYRKIYGRKRCIVMCVICWLVAFMFEIGNFLGWGDHFYDQKNHSCIWNRTKNQSYTYFVGVVLIIAPLGLMFFANLRIFLTIHDTKSRLLEVTKSSKDSGDDDDHGINSKSVWKETVKSCRSLFIIYAIFFICWMPYGTIILVDIWNDKISMPVHLFLTLLAHFHSSINFTIYMASNRHFRAAFLSTFFYCGKKSVRELLSSGTTSYLATTSTSATTQNTKS